jgi:hypothetical protein
MMRPHTSRRDWIAGSSFTLAMFGMPNLPGITEKSGRATAASADDAALSPNHAEPPIDDADPKPDLWPTFPQQDPKLVQEVVGASHSRLERVVQIVTASPALATAAWDWGFGDWESALGAASHTGRRDIAEFLIQHGARPDIFTHAMLGHLDVVRAMVESQPAAHRTFGPHGINLMRHAHAGLPAAAPVVAYLETLEGADDFAMGLETPESMQARYIGTYRYGESARDILTVYVNGNGALMMQGANETGRFLHRTDTDTFAPSGAPAVRIHFRMNGDLAQSLTVHDPMPIVTAVR